MLALRVNSFLAAFMLGGAQRSQADKCVRSLADALGSKWAIYATTVNPCDHGLSQNRERTSCENQLIPPACPCVSRSVQICPDLSKSVQICPDLSRSVQICPDLSICVWAVGGGDCGVRAASTLLPTLLPENIKMRQRTLRDFLSTDHPEEFDKLTATMVGTGGNTFIPSMKDNDDDGAADDDEADGDKAGDADDGGDGDDDGYDDDGADDAGPDADDDAAFADDVEEAEGYEEDEGEEE
eukprot:158869-Pyramimonas_sp.AAC.1